MKREKGRVNPVVIILIILILLATGFLGCLIFAKLASPRSEQEVNDAILQACQETPDDLSGLISHANTYLENSLDDTEKYLNCILERNKDQPNNYETVSLIASFWSKKGFYEKSNTVWLSLDFSALNNAEKYNAYIEMADNYAKLENKEMQQKYIVLSEEIPEGQRGFWS